MQQKVRAAELDRPAEAPVLADDKDFGRAAAKRMVAMPEPQVFAPVRVFPVPAFTPDYAGPRNDYRETVFWAPSVKTDRRGKATVKFVLSDAVTSFRVSSEGVGGGLDAALARFGEIDVVARFALDLPRLLEELRKAHRHHRNVAQHFVAHATGRGSKTHVGLAARARHFQREEEAPPLARRERAALAAVA